MAYYLYKKIRDKRRAANDLDLQRNVAPASTTRPQEQPSTDEDFRNDSTISATVKNEKTTHDNEAVNESKAAELSAEEKSATRKYRWRVIGGIFFPMLAWSLNKTMIAVALPFIASDFHQFSQLNWIISAAELTGAAFVPSFGQFADIFGRYWSLQGSVLFMILGSALCAGAPTSNFPMLLAGRGLQGVATAGMMVMTRIVLSDKVSLRDNAINNTFFSLVSGIGFGVGPVVGGYLTSVSWRWCFILNIPLSVIGLVITHFISRPVMLGPQDLYSQDGATEISRSSSFLNRLRTVDFGGQLLFLFGMGLFVLALTWAGAYYPWADVRVLAPLAIGSVLLILFLIWEYLLLPGRALAQKFPHQQPMIALNLVWTRNAGLLMYINFITGMAMYAAFYFVELYFTIVKEFGSDEAGRNLLYYLPGLAGGVYLAMFLCNVWPRRTWYPLSFGTWVEALGITLIAIALHSNSLPFVYAMLAITGLGTGVRYMPNTLHSVGYFRKSIAGVVSLMGLAVNLGSTLASTIMLNIFNNRMSSAGISLVQGSGSASSFSSINQLPHDEQLYVRQHAKNSLVVAFYGISSFMWLGVIAVMFLGSVNIKKESESSKNAAAGTSASEHLTKGAYIASLFRRTAVEQGEAA